VPDPGQAEPAGQRAQALMLVAPVALDDVPGGHGTGLTVALGQ